MRQKGADSFFKEIIAVKFPNMGEKQTSRSRMHRMLQKKKNPKKSTLRHTIIKMSKVKDKERILKQ